MLRPPPAVAPRAVPQPQRETDIRWVTDILRRVDLTPPANFPAQLRAAKSDAEAEDIIGDQVGRAIRAVRAEHRAREKAKSNGADSRGD